MLLDAKAKVVPDCLVLVAPSQKDFASFSNTYVSSWVKFDFCFLKF